MDMRLRFAAISVVTVTPAIVPPGAATQPLEHVTYPDAYAIYALLLRQKWATRLNEMLWLQQETELSSRCSTVPAADPEWATVESNFKQENARTRLLQPLLPIDYRTFYYHLVPRAEIEADVHVWR